MAEQNALVPANTGARNVAGFLQAFDGLMQTAPRAKPTALAAVGRGAGSNPVATASKIVVTDTAILETSVKLIDTDRTLPFVYLPDMREGGYVKDDGSPVVVENYKSNARIFACTPIKPPETQKIVPKTGGAPRIRRTYSDENPATEYTGEHRGGSCAPKNTAWYACYGLVPTQFVQQKPGDPDSDGDGAGAEVEDPGDHDFVVRRERDVVPRAAGAEITAYPEKCTPVVWASIAYVTFAPNGEVPSIEDVLHTKRAEQLVMKAFNDLHPHARLKNLPSNLKELAAINQINAVATYLDNFAKVCAGTGNPLHPDLLSLVVCLQPVISMQESGTEVTVVDKKQVVADVSVFSSANPQTAKRLAFLSEKVNAEITPAKARDDKISLISFDAFVKALKHHVADKKDVSTAKKMTNITTFRASPYPLGFKVSPGFKTTISLEEKREGLKRGIHQLASADTQYSMKKPTGLVITHESPEMQLGVLYCKLATTPDLPADLAATIEDLYQLSTAADSSSGDPTQVGIAFEESYSTSPRSIVLNGRESADRYMMSQVFIAALVLYSGSKSKGYCDALHTLATKWTIQNLEKHLAGDDERPSNAAEFLLAEQCSMLRFLVHLLRRLREHYIPGTTEFRIQDTCIKSYPKTPAEMAELMPKLIDPIYKLAASCKYDKIREEPFPGDDDLDAVIYVAYKRLTPGDAAAADLTVEAAKELLASDNEALTAQVRAYILDGLEKANI